jgi:hypothetical protein
VYEGGFAAGSLARIDGGIEDQDLIEVRWNVGLF